MTRITTHVLDTAAGHPVAGMEVTLAEAAGAGADGWRELARARTDDDGRITDFPDVDPGRCRLGFATASPFFGEVVVSFAVPADRDHLHVPLLLSPYGYTVYRGS